MLYKGTVGASEKYIHAGSGIYVFIKKSATDMTEFNLRRIKNGVIRQGSVDLDLCVCGCVVYNSETSFLLCIFKRPTWRISNK